LNVLFEFIHYIPASETLIGIMAFAAVSRVRKGKAKDENVIETAEEALPSYLLEFPDESSRIKDLQLAVLLGRFGRVTARIQCLMHLINPRCDIFLNLIVIISFSYSELGKRGDLYTQKM
jgi:hypothetical protein